MAGDSKEGRNGGRGKEGRYERGRIGRGRREGGGG